MAKYTKEDIIRLVEEENVKFIRLQFSDIFGMLKNVAVTASQIEKVVNNQIMIDGSSIEGFVRINESDQYLRPDLDSFAIMPWRPMNGKVARLMCSVYNPDGTPFVGDPRNVLQKAISTATEEGYTFNVGPECEFFLFETDEKGRPTTYCHDRGGYFDVPPQCRRTMQDTLTSARWIMARRFAGTCVWHWRPWALKSKPAIMR